MRKTIVLLLTLFVSASVLAQVGVLPYPDSVVMGPGKYRITSGFSIGTSVQDPVLLASVNRFYHRLNKKTSAYFRQDYITPGLQGDMHLEATSVQVLHMGMDESYVLTITRQSIDLRAATTVGAMRALETLLQLVQRDDEGFYFPEVKITDKPRLAWRGLMIDVARHFIPMDVIRRNVEAMATVKMNVLHLHLTDDEGFRIESRQFPRLHQLGSNGNYYTQEEMRSLVRFAAERGVMVIPEFDLPGHSQSWFAGYPELASAPGPYKPGPRFNTDNVKSMADMMAMINTAPTPAIDPTRESVYQFMDKFLGEMKTIFPYAYFHIGGDENNGAAWKKNPQIAAFMKKNKMADTHALEAYFISKMYTVVSKHKYRMIVWEEALRDNLPKDVIVQKWKPDMGMMGGKPVTIQSIVQQGYDVLLSAGWYLDHHFPAHVYYQNQALKQYEASPAATGKLLGGEAAQWTEIADGGNIEGRIWINSAAIAERLWGKAAATDIDDLYRRLALVNLQLDAQGLDHISNYQRVLRQWKRSDDTRDIAMLTNILTPVKGYKRLIPKMVMPRNRTQSTAPMNEVADMLLINSFSKRQFRQLVAAYLSTQDRDAAKAIRQQLQSWQAMTWNSYQQPALEAVRPHAVHLQQLSAIALEAMDQRDKGIILLDWVNKQQDLLKKAAIPVADTELDVLPELAALINGKLLAEPLSYPLF